MMSVLFWFLRAKELIYKHLLTWDEIPLKVFGLLRAFTSFVLPVFNGSSGVSVDDVWNLRDF